MVKKGRGATVGTFSSGGATRVGGERRDLTSQRVMWKH
jgi:hypothetical protein